MNQLTVSNIITAIAQLPKNQAFNYINPRNRGVIEVVNVTFPEGPIIIKRYNPSNGETSAEARETSVSTQMMRRIADAFVPNQPLNIDITLGASYNTRSAFETLLAHTSQFYYCYPKRIDSSSSSSSSSTNRVRLSMGHKYLMWVPDNPHRHGVIEEIDTDIVISHLPLNQVYYDSIDFPIEYGETELEIDVKRRHSQIQVALIMIGQQLGFRTWVAQNDRGILYKNQRVAELPSVVDSLQQENLIFPYEGAVKSALLIDCIWFKNGRLMPAVMEVEHSTGVTSGLTRMKNLYDLIPSYQQTRYVIVAPDEEKAKVLREANKPQFKDLNTKFFPYSAVEELYSLCQRRKIRGITEEFLDSFMEPTIDTDTPSLYQ